MFTQFHRALQASIIHPARHPHSIIFHLLFFTWRGLDVTRGLRRTRQHFHPDQGD
jgi:hypothetical protein